MTKRTNCILLVAVMLMSVLSSCKDTGRTLPSATGTIYELLVVSDNATNTQAIIEFMGADMPCLPQMEPYFTVSSVTTAQFDNLLLPSRNILQVDVNPERYTQGKIVFKTDVFSHPQAFCRIQLPDNEQFDSIWNANQESIRNFFIRQEITRQCSFYYGYRNSETNQKIANRFGCQMTIPDEYMLIMDTTIVCDGAQTSFMWCCNNGGSLRRDIIIYSYPYTNPNTFTGDFLFAKRDSVVARLISAKMEGTYMTTEYNQIPPQFSPISVQDNAYCAEVRGLWKMNGAAMGGAFVSHTRLDEINQKVITVETFQFAPGQKKRNELRKAEAILYTMKLPQEINAIKEVTVKN